MTFTALKLRSGLAVLAAAAALVGGLAASPALAAENAAPAANAQAFKPKGGLVLRMGDFEVLALIDDEFVTDAKGIGRTPEQWKGHEHLQSPDGKVRGEMGGHLIRNKLNKRLVLVDAGIGPRPTFNRTVDATMMRELAAFGYKPEDITDVVFSHLHPDHTGWAYLDGKPVFPNATYWCHQAEWDHWVKTTPTADDWIKVSPKPLVDYFVKAAGDFVRPLEPRLKTYSSASMEMFPGLTLRQIPGHTPGSTIVQLDSQGQRALILGDVAASPLDLVDKTWDKIHYDTNAAQAIATRNALIDEIVRDDPAVSGNHFARMRFGHVVSTPKGLRFYYNEASPD
ncbi:MAG: MBL fold metallo-hydrolase [Phenylobacterium sp.]